MIVREISKEALRVGDKIKIKDDSHTYNDFYDKDLNGLRVGKIVTVNRYVRMPFAVSFNNYEMSYWFEYKDIEGVVISETMQETELTKVLY